jgi:hypothetical protein
MSYRVLVEASTRANQAVTANAWEVIRSTVGSLNLPEDWQRAYHTRSLTLKSIKRNATVKITLDAQVFVDICIGKGEFRSKKVQAPDIAQACEDARQVLLALC